MTSEILYSMCHFIVEQNFICPWESPLIWRKFSRTLDILFDTSKTHTVFKIKNWVQNLLIHFKPCDLNINGTTEIKFKSWINGRKWLNKQVPLIEKVKKNEQNYDGNAPKVIYVSWKESGLFDIDPNLLVEEVVTDEISDDELSENFLLELCPESELFSHEF